MILNYSLLLLISKTLLDFAEAVRTVRVWNKSSMIWGGPVREIRGSIGHKIGRKRSETHAASIV